MFFFCSAVGSFNRECSTRCRWNIVFSLLLDCENMGAGQMYFFLSGTWCWEYGRSNVVHCTIRPALVKYSSLQIVLRRFSLVHSWRWQLSDIVQLEVLLLSKTQGKPCIEGTFHLFLNFWRESEMGGTPIQLENKIICWSLCQKLNLLPDFQWNKQQ